MSGDGNVTSWQRMEINDDWWCSKAQVLDSIASLHLFQQGLKLPIGYCPKLVELWSTRFVKYYTATFPFCSFSRLKYVNSKRKTTSHWRLFSIMTLRFNSFVYLGSCIDVHGGSEPDICRRIEKARSCMKSLDRNIWRSSISRRSRFDFTMCTYSRYFFTELTRGVYDSGLDVSMHLTNSVFAV